jgi:hypothetical protein
MPVVLSLEANNMRRREFLGVLSGAVAAWPLVARAQQTAMPVIGFMSGRSPEDSAYVLSAFRQGFAGTGFVEGQNVAIEFRWAQGDYDRSMWNFHICPRLRLLRTMALGRSKRGCAETYSPLRLAALAIGHHFSISAFW